MGEDETESGTQSSTKKFCCKQISIFLLKSHFSGAFQLCWILGGCENLVAVLVFPGIDLQPGIIRLIHSAPGTGHWAVDAKSADHRTAQAPS